MRKGQLKFLGIKGGFLLSVLSLFSTAVQAESAVVADHPGNYAFGRELQLWQKAPFYRITLPEAVYAQSVFPDLRDVRVFDANGKLMPFAFYHQENVQQKKTSFALTLFPLSQKNVVEKEEQRNMVLKYSDGSEVTFPLDRQGHAEAFSQSYLMRYDGEDKTYGSKILTLNWPDADAGWQAEVSVYSSTNMKNWRDLVTGAPLIDLVSGTERLKINSVELPGFYLYKNTYLLAVIRAKDGQRVPKITSVTGVETAEDIRDDLISLRFTPKRLSSYEVEYRLERPQPLTELVIFPAQDNVVLPLEISYLTNTEQETWSLLEKRAIYRAAGSSEDSIEALNMRDQLVQAIRIKGINQQELSDPLPDVIGKRKKQTLVFNMQGNAPFVLAWGSVNAQPKALTPDMLLPKDYVLNRDASIADVTEKAVLLCGESCLVSAKKEDSNYKFVLWGILILGVAGLGLLAFRLWREVQKSDNSTAG